MAGPWGVPRSHPQVPGLAELPLGTGRSKAPPAVWPSSHGSLSSAKAARQEPRAQLTSGHQAVTCLPEQEAEACAQGSQPCPCSWASTPASTAPLDPGWPRPAARSCLHPALCTLLTDSGIFPEPSCRGLPEATQPPHLPGGAQGSGPVLPLQEERALGSLPPPSAGWHSLVGCKHSASPAWPHSSTRVTGLDRSAHQLCTRHSWPQGHHPHSLGTEPLSWGPFPQGQRGANHISYSLRPWPSPPDTAIETNVWWVGHDLTEEKTPGATVSLRAGPPLSGKARL